MNLPVVAYPTYVTELAEQFQPVFNQKRQYEQFKRLMSGFVIADKCTIANMNGLFLYHTNQSNLNRFVTQSNWNPNKMIEIEIDLINSIEKGGILVIDDYVVEKYGKEIYGTDWHRDHCKKRSIWGLQIADCVLTGYGTYSLLSTVYVRKGSRWCTKGFKKKSEIQLEHIKRLVKLGLKFSCVVMDSWYCSKNLLQQIKRMKKDWIAQCKSNRLIRSGKRWISLRDFAERKFAKVPFRVIKIDLDTYFMKAFTVTMKGMGRVRVLISQNKHGNFNFYMTNRVDWNEVAIAKRYSRRWAIEVWHREGKGNYGLEDCQLRSDEAVTRYLTLSSLAANLLEIASLLSPVYATLQNRGWTPELKHRWVLAELVSQLISSASQVQDLDLKQVIESILCPYTSTLREGKVKNMMESDS